MKKPKEYFTVHYSIWTKVGRNPRQWSGGELKRVTLRRLLEDMKDIKRQHLSFGPVFHCVEINVKA